MKDSVVLASLGGPSETPSDALSDEVLDAHFALEIVGWNGNASHCVYLNDFRIAGGKPWGGGTTTKAFKHITLRDVIRAIPELQAALGFDYLGQRRAL